MRLLLLLTLASIGLTGCGAVSSNACSGSLGPAILVVSPTSATAVSNTVSPTNQVTFYPAFTYPQSTVRGNCAIPTVIVIPAVSWTNPDPVDIDIGSSTNLYSNTATCKAPTKGPVTLTANSTTSGSVTISASVQLTCQ